MKRNIDRQIYKNISHKLKDYGYFNLSDDIDDFLKKRKAFSARKDMAIKIITKIMVPHGKRKLYKYIVKLAETEAGARELSPKLRDHVNHAVLTFFLGIYIYEEVLKQNFVKCINPFEWQLACLFHDIGYPAQIAAIIADTYVTEVNSIIRDIGVDSPHVRQRIMYDDLESLTDRKNAFDLIQEKLDLWEVNIDIKSINRNIIESGKICHGIISALSLIKVIDALYKKYNPRRKYEEVIHKSMGSDIDWNRHYFDNEVVSACTAICLHNLDNHWFEDTVIDYRKAPVAYLLRISDNLQEWDRPSLENKKGYGVSKFQIILDGNKLKYNANIEQEKINDIRNNILCCLNSDQLIEVIKAN